LERRQPLGQQIHSLLMTRGHTAAAELAREAGQADLFERISAVASEVPTPSFLHSALCAMSLPVRRPADDQAAIIRQDGQYTLVITPKPVLISVGGQQQLSVLGVPYGSLPRLVLIHIMTEAVRNKSRHVELGTCFTDWMRRLGFRTVSYGPRGSATLIRQQLDRLLACEWMIRWDSDPAQAHKEFGVKEIKLTNEYVGVDRKNGSFVREIFLTEGFFDHLRKHAVPLNEHAIRQLRDSATALDLYTWLAYRLPRINQKRPATLSWQQLAVHFGNDRTNIRKFRQTVREAWNRQVSGVYPEARAEFDASVIRLYASPAPLQQRLVQGAHLKLVTDDKGAPTTEGSPASHPSPEAPEIPALFMAAITTILGPVEARAWFHDARLEAEGEDWILRTSTQFKASWIRTTLVHALVEAAARIGLSAAPEVRVQRS
jgi:Plasmid encoded RepA protein